jgi:predicted permease
MLSDLVYRIRAILTRRSMERDLEDELGFHLERQIAHYESTGLSRTEAARRARLEFGGVEQVKEEARDARGISLIETVVRDLAYGVRSLARVPGFTLIAVLSLGLGIGANTAIFELLDALRLRVLPVKAPQELVLITVADMSRARGSRNGEDTLTYALWDQIRAHQRAFSGVFAWSETELNLAPPGEVRVAPAVWVSGEFFPVLGLTPSLGRLFSAADDYRGCGTSPGAVISYTFWQSEFGGDPGAIGRDLTVNGRRTRLIGVVQPGFTGLNVGRRFDIALPLCSVATLWFDALNANTMWWLNVAGRLAPGWSPERAAAQMASISPGIFAASLPPNYPAVSVKDYLAMKLTAKPAAAGLSHLRDQYAVLLWMLLGIAGLVMLIACANLANLMLARATARERETAVRLAIGASRGRLIAQFMTESILLAAAGAGAGLLISGTLGRALVTLLAAEDSETYLSLQVDWRVLAFTGALCVLTCVLFGLAPALRATGDGCAPVLKSAGRGLTATREHFDMRAFLIASQVALSLVLLAGALLFVQSLRNLLRVDTGFRQDGILIADFRFARPDPSRVNLLTYQQVLLDRIRSVPGVVSAADTTIVPLEGNSSSNQMWMAGKDPSQSIGCLLTRVSPGYFQTLDIPLLAGRDLNDHDTRQSPRVAVVNRVFAERVAHAPNPAGRRFRVEATPSTPETEYEIVGLAGNSRYRSLREEFEPIVYFPLSQDPTPMLQDQLLIRSSVPHSRLIPLLRRAIAEADPEARFAFSEFAMQIESSVAAERLMATLASGFGVLAGVLAAIGIYGVISYLVDRRRNEIGIRVALGASRGRILIMVLRATMKVLIAGLSAGILLSLLAATSARAILFGLKPYDVRTLVAAAAVLSIVALLAAYVPARRAARLDPMTALREE